MLEVDGVVGEVCVGGVGVYEFDDDLKWYVCGDVGGVGDVGMDVVVYDV